MAWSDIPSSSELKPGLNATGSAPIYAPRAWWDLNGTGSIAMNNSGNCTATDNGTGLYTINFTTAMPATTYAVALGEVTAQGTTTTTRLFIQPSNSTFGLPEVKTTSALKLGYATSGAPGAYYDCASVVGSVTI